MGNAVGINTFMSKSWKESIAMINESINYCPPQQRVDSESSGHLLTRSYSSGFTNNLVCARILFCNHTSFPIYLIQCGSIQGNFHNDLGSSTFSGPLQSLPSGQCTGFVHQSNRPLLPIATKGSRGYVKLRIKGDDGLKYMIVLGFSVEANGNNRVGVRIIPLWRQYSQDDTMSLSVSSISTPHSLSKASSLIVNCISPEDELTASDVDELLNVCHARQNILEMQEVKYESPHFEIEIFFNNEDAGLFVVNFHNVVTIIRD